MLLNSFITICCDKTNIFKLEKNLDPLDTTSTLIDFFTLYKSNKLDRPDFLHTIRKALPTGIWKVYQQHDFLLEPKLPPDWIFSGVAHGLTDERPQVFKGN